MTATTPNVLLIANPMGMSFLVARLKHWTCEIHVASSCKEAHELVSERRFDLVLSEFRLWDGSAYPLADLLIGSDTTLFYSYPVETGCWWLPAVKNGKSVWGSLAMRPNEFISFLENTVREIRLRQTASSGDFSEPLFKATGK
jgi:hypothetical protein